MPCGACCRAGCLQPSAVLGAFQFFVVLFLRTALVCVVSPRVRVAESWDICRVRGFAAVLSFVAKSNAWADPCVVDPGRPVTH